MFSKLFLSRQVHIIDGDGRLNACTDKQLISRFQYMIDNGMPAKGIQIFHYAAVHYNTRWNNYPARFLNALLNSASSISDNGSYLSLNNSEEPELQRDSSEVLGIGLSIMFMCRWYMVNINRIEKIQGSGKRCDYRFPYNNQVVVFESKGRSHKSSISSARADCIKKKSTYHANLMYAAISYLPRDGSPTTLSIFDPPVDDGFISFDEKYMIAKHYSRVSELSGLTILAEAIRKRIRQYEKTGEWDTSPLLMSNVTKIGMSIQIGNNTFWTRRSIQEFEYGAQKYYAQFGLHNKVIDLLMNWNIDELSRFRLEDRVIEDHNLSLLSDGSLFYLGNQRLE